MTHYVQPEALMPANRKKELRQRLDAFYEQVSDYAAFSQPSEQTNCWEYIANELARRAKPNCEGAPKIRVLEVGAGRSGFGAWLATRDIRNSIHWSAQDVTRQNEQWLREQADEVIIGDVSIIDRQSCFDIIFSTYVLEHISDPRKHLETLQGLLADGGSLFIICPRYDMPGYLNPSCRHLGRIAQLEILVATSIYRLRSFLTKQPAFLIQTDLAAFHGPFFTDADAVHWVSEIDLRIWAAHRSLKIKRLAIGHARVGSKNWIIRRFLTCAIELQHRSGVGVY
jgi:2-polyprenyl-3-methyl-5-hydroxy-6-metoxy-1,4-benzoquinol methylase